MFWVVQMSREMWEYSPDGDLKFETFLNYFTQAKPLLNPNSNPCSIFCSGLMHSVLCTLSYALYQHLML